MKGAWCSRIQNWWSLSNRSNQLSFSGMRSVVLVSFFRNLSWRLTKYIFIYPLANSPSVSFSSVFVLLVSSLPAPKISTHFRGDKTVVLNPRRMALISSSCCIQDIVGMARRTTPCWRTTDEDSRSLRSSRAISALVLRFLYTFGWACGPALVPRKSSMLRRRRYYWYEWQRPLSLLLSSSILSSKRKLAAHIFMRVDEIPYLSDVYIRVTLGGSPPLASLVSGS